MMSQKVDESAENPHFIPIKVSIEQPATIAWSNLFVVSLNHNLPKQTTFGTGTELRTD